MKRIWTQVKYHLKKDKGSYVSFGIIILFTALMLNLALVLLFQVDEAYDEKFDKLNTASINFYISKKQDVYWLEDRLKSIDGVKETETREAVYLEAVVKEFRDEDFSMNTLFYNVNMARKLNKLDIKIEESVSAENAIYIPFYVSNFGEFEVGDNIVYEIGGKSYTFIVAGVLEEMQYGNYGKGLMGAYLSKGAYESFKSEKEDNIVTEYSLLVEKNSDIEKIKNEITDLLSENGILKLGMCDAASTKDTRTMVCSLIILILAAFSLVVLAVSVSLCKFRISNSIDEEIVSMGVLKAIGYTGNMIIGSIVTPYAIVTVISASLGVLCSYAVLPILADVLAMQSGFSFEIYADIKSLLCVLVILIGIVLLFSYRSARRIRGIGAIDAMRSCSGEKRKKKNHLPLETTRGKVSVLLILKQMLSCGKQNVLLFFVSFALSILVAFASMLFYNVIVEPDNFMSTLSEEVPDAIITSKEEVSDEMIGVLRNDKRVEAVLRYFTENIEVGDKNAATTVTAFICEDFDRVTNDLCYKGENPKAQNEIALGSIFEETYNIGDAIQLKSGDKVCEYKVTGFVQSVNSQGNICELTSQGYEQLYGIRSATSLYVYLGEGESAEAFLKEYEKEYSDEIVSVINSEKMQKASQEMFSDIVYVIVVAIFVLTMFILLFILYIVIRSLIVQRKQELGIYKAIGYSNMQLMLQVSGSFLPVSIGAVVISSMLGIWYLPYINGFIFEMVGAMKNNMEVSISFLMIFALVQIVLNFAISVILAMPIKRISAYSLLKEN